MSEMKPQVNTDNATEAMLQLHRGEATRWNLFSCHIDNRVTRNIHGGSRPLFRRIAVFLAALSEKHPISGTTLEGSERVHYGVPETIA